MNLSVMQIPGEEVIPIKEIGNYKEKGIKVNLAVDFSKITDEVSQTRYIPNDM